MAVAFATCSHSCQVPGQAFSVVQPCNAMGHGQMVKSAVVFPR